MRAALSILAVIGCVSGLFFPSLSQAAEQRYECAAGAITGFMFSAGEGAWKGASDRVDTKFLIVPQDKSREMAYMVYRAGQQYADAYCKEDFNEYGYLNCQKGSWIFKFNKRSGRFLYVSAEGYINVAPELKITDETSAAPYMLIGKCSLKQ
jgi:hypothetical protein